MTIEIKTIDAQVRSLEEELKALKILVEYAAKHKKGTKTFASLKGIWKGKVHFTMDEIKEEDILNDSRKIRKGNPSSMGFKQYT